MPVKAPLDILALRIQRDRAYKQFLQKWRRDIVLLRQQRMGNFGPLIGDLTCQFNAQSAYLRCAVNPMGPCEGCPHYQRIQ